MLLHTYSLRNSILFNTISVLFVTFTMSFNSFGVLLNLNTATVSSSYSILVVIVIDIQLFSLSSAIAILHLPLQIKVYPRLSQKCNARDIHTCVL